MTRIGVYVCHCGLNIGGVVDVEKVAEYAKTFPDVPIARHCTYTCSEQGQAIIKRDIETEGLDRVVIGACSPRMHEETFRRVIAESGLNAYLLEIVNLREQVSWPHSGEPEEATEKAKALIRMGIERSRFLESLEKKKVSVSKSVLVVGGGIAGIQASLDLANSGLKVYLVEKTLSIGGRMARLDKTFPTLDCSACILMPRMVDVAKHSSITLVTNSEVAEVTGSVGNYEVSILEKPRYVKDTCIACGLCAGVCPVNVADEFNEGLSEKKAISIVSPNAVPRTAAINAEHCLRLKTGKKVCGKCQAVCEAKAIDFDQESKINKVKVGGIIIAVGSEVFDARQVPELGYGRFKDVISNAEFERLCDASGPTGGRILSPSGGEEPKTVAFVQCVGSRDARYHEYCCRVGCMVALKQAILVREKIHSEVRVYVCYIDIRAFGKGYDEFYKRARDLDIDFLAGIPSEIRRSTDGKLYFEVYDKNTSKLVRISPDLIVLANGLVPTSDIQNISRLFHAPRSFDGFLLEAHPKLHPLESATSGVFLAGACQGPKDIPDTVGQASGAAAKAIDLLSSGQIELEPLRAVVDQDSCSGCGICRSQCPFAGIEVKPAEESKGRRPSAEVIEAACQGCGICSSACPSGAISIQQYTNRQLTAQVQTAFSQDGLHGGR